MASYSDDVKTPLARLAFANLFKPKKKDKPEDADKWDCTLLFPKSTDLKALKTAALDACEKEWPGKAAQWLKDGLIKNPFLDGDDKPGLNKTTGERHEGFAGCVFIRCGTLRKPKVVDKKVMPVTDPDEVYSGCYVFAVINAYTWEDSKNGKGVSFGLQMVQFAKDGERLAKGGGGDPSQHFEAIPDDGADEPAGSTGGGAADLFN